MRVNSERPKTRCAGWFFYPDLDPESDVREPDTLKILLGIVVIGYFGWFTIELFRIAWIELSWLL